MDIETRIELVEQYCARGWHVFPCHGKRPATRTGLYAGSDDVVRWRAQWLAAHLAGREWNIGIWTGASKLLVVDCDVPKRGPSIGPFDDEAVGPAGISGWLALCATFDHDPDDTYAVVTPSGGIHYYYAYEDEDYIPPSVEKLGVRIDTRSFGSYVVAAGSEVDGMEYEHVGAAEVLPAPDWLIELLAVVPKATEVVLEARRKDRELYSKSNVNFLTLLIRDVREAAEGQRNSEAAAKMYRILKAGGTEEELDMIVQAGRDAGLSDRELQAMKATVIRKV